MHDKIDKIYFFLQNFSMLSKILKIVTSLTLMRKINIVNESKAVTKSKKNSDFPTCAKSGVYPDLDWCQNGNSNTDPDRHQNDAHPQHCTKEIVIFPFWLIIVLNPSLFIKIR
jgi:hypothetical protein